MDLKYFEYASVCQFSHHAVYNTKESQFDVDLSTVFNAITQFVMDGGMGGEGYSVALIPARYKYQRLLKPSIYYKLKRKLVYPTSLFKITRQFCKTTL